MTQETLFDLIKVAGGYVAGALSTFLTIRARNRENRERRRAEVRKPLIEFANRVGAIAGGGYPMPNTHAGWSPVYEGVTGLQQEVVGALLLDRRTAGWWWSRKVTKCVGLGLKLVKGHEGCARGMFGGKDSDLYIKELEELRKQFAKAFGRVV